MACRWSGHYIRHGRYYRTLISQADELAATWLSVATLLRSHDLDTVLDPSQRECLAHKADSIALSFQTAADLLREDACALGFYRAHLAVARFHLEEFGWILLGRMPSCPPGGPSPSPDDDAEESEDDGENDGEGGPEEHEDKDDEEEEDEEARSSTPPAPASTDTPQPDPTERPIPTREATSTPIEPTQARHTQTPSPSDAPTMPPEATPTATLFPCAPDPSSSLISCDRFPEGSAERNLCEIRNSSVVQEQELRCPDPPPLASWQELLLITAASALLIIIVTTRKLWLPWSPMRR